VTDGSFTVKTTGAKDTIISEQILRNAGEGTGGIVLMPRNPINQVLDIHIKSDKPQPGMNAYTWELLTRVVGLQIMKFMPSTVKGHSDCMSAIIHLNDAMLAFHDTQSRHSGCADLWWVPISSGKGRHQRPDIEDPRLISWIRSHPKKDERAQYPDEMAKGIFMADAVAAVEHETVKTLGSNKLPTVQVKTFELKNIMNKIIPIFQWHFCSAADLNVPILKDPAHN
jgi:hypothetical protein